jgi:hypothetical protein
MKTRYILLICLTITVLMSSMLFGQLIQINEPNMVSEGNIYENPGGTRYSELVTFKFKYKMANMNRGEVIVSENKILYPAFRQLLSSLRNQYGNFVIKKSVPDVIWGDTIGVNKRTNQTVIVNDLSQIYRITFSNPVPTEQVANILKTHSNVKYAEGPIIAYLTISPNDPWYLDQNYRWSFNVINAETAWDITTGSPLIGIGFSDQFGGVSQLHQDLVGQVVWHNLSSFGGHGIITAGVAGALTNNGTDIASLGWNVKLLLNQFWGQNSSTINGVRNLVLFGADVINFSWVSSSYYSQMADIIQYALQHGRVCVASAGNNEWTIPGVRYPAAYNFGNLGQVIAVSATLLTNGVEDWVTNFNYSPGTDPINDPTNAFIDCSAPGTNYRALYDLGPTGTKHIWAGTSISAPFVSALVGLMLSVNSTLTPAQVYDIIVRTTDRVGSNPYSSIGWNRYLGYGRIDAANAVNVATGAPAKPRGFNLTVYNTGSNSHPKLTWELVPESNITNYLIERSLNGSPFTQIASLNNTTTQYIDYGVSWAGGGPYTATYKIRAKNSLNKFSTYTTPKSIQYGDVWKVSDDQDIKKDLNYSLSQNYPNPFNPSTIINYTIKTAGVVTLKVYDMLGTEAASLVDENKEAGSYSVEFNASSLPSGIYFYTLTSGNFTATKKLILLK